MSRGLGQQPVEERRRHRPGIEIESAGAGGRGMKGRIDVIGAGLGGAHGDAPSFQRGEKPERHRGLARSRAWSRDDEAARGHRARSLSAMTRASSRSCRTFTIFPTTMIEGVPSWCCCASVATRASVETTIRSSAVVAATMTAAGGARRQAAAHQLVGDRREVAHRHIQHDRLAGARQRRPIEAVVVDTISGGKDNGPVDPSERRRDAGRGQSRQSRRHARDDAVRHARGGEHERFLAAAAEYAGVAALEPQHAMAGARQLDETVRDIVLVGGRPAAAFACEFKPRLRPRQRQDAAIHERVVNDDVGLRKAGERIERQQARISRPRSREPDMPRREHRGVGAQRQQLRFGRSWHSPAHAHGLSSPRKRRR